MKLVDPMHLLASHLMGLISSRFLGADKLHLVFLLDKFVFYYVFEFGLCDESLENCLLVFRTGSRTVEVQQP